MTYTNSDLCHYVVDFLQGRFLKKIKPRHTVITALGKCTLAVALQPILGFLFRGGTRTSRINSGCFLLASYIHVLVRTVRSALNWRIQYGQDR